MEDTLGLTYCLWLKLRNKSVGFPKLALLMGKMGSCFHDCGFVVRGRKLYNGVDMAHIKYEHAIAFHRLLGCSVEAPLAEPTAKTGRNFEYETIVALLLNRSNGPMEKSNVFEIVELHCTSQLSAQPC